MPSWSIHLKIGKELNKKLNINNDSFMFGSLIPDADSDWKIGRFKAHYYGNLKFPKCPNENMIDLKAFINDYKDYMQNPLIIGYYCHLLTDNYYNEYIYYNKWIQDQDNNIIGIRKKNGGIIDISDNFKQSLYYKHSDLELYGKRIYNKEKLIIPQNIDRICDSINLLKDKFITKENVSKRIYYLNNEFLKFNMINEEEINKDYEIFSKEELDDLLEKCIKYIENELEKVGVLNER